MKRTILLLITFCSMSYSSVSVLEMNLIKSIIPGSKIVDAEKSPIDGLYIVMLENKKFLYVYPFKNIIFFGEMMSNKGENISVVMKDKLIKDNMSNKDFVKEINEKNEALKMMKEIALSVVYGQRNRKYDLYIFTDPDCPFCQTLEKKLSTSSANVHYIFTPIKRLHPLAEYKSKQLISDSEDIPILLEKIRNGEGINSSIIANSESVLSKMKKVAKMFNFESTPVTIVVDKKTNKVIDFVQGADLSKLQQYLKGDENEK